MIAQVAICGVHPFFTMVKSVDPVTDADATCNIAGLAAEFVTVIVCAALAVLVSWLPKFAVVGETLICAITAFPLTAMDCGLCGALSLICTVAERLPAAVGLNVTLNAQVIFTPRLAGQLFGAVKSPGSAPLTPIDEIASGDAPEFVSVTLTGEVVSPMVLVPNPTLAVESVAPSVTAVA